LPTYNLAPSTIKSFRCAQELCSSEPAQLKRTIEELEARVREQDTLIFQKDEYIEELSQKLTKTRNQLFEMEHARSKPDLYPVPDGLKVKVRMDGLEKQNRYMENLLSDFEEGFWSLFNTQKDRLKENLDLLAKLPAAPETKSLHARVKKESQAILTARARKITPVNALKQLSELEEPVIKFILSRPALTFTSIEAFRAEVLLENMRISRVRCLIVPQASKILVEREEKPVNRMMTQRTMRRASKLYRI
jgi:hypothetical protein